MNNENGHISKVLIGKKAIKKYTGINSDESLQKWISRGMPILIEENRFYAHKDNLDNFFKVVTNIMTKEVPEGTE